jgi:hypothetical protein
MLHDKHESYDAISCIIYSIHVQQMKQLSTIGTLRNDLCIEIVSIQHDEPKKLAMHYWFNFMCGSMICYVCMK